MKDFMNVFTASMAKELLKRGYTISDLKKDKYDSEGKRSIFVFKNEMGLEETVKELVALEKEKKLGR